MSSPEITTGVTMQPTTTWPMYSEAKPDDGASPGLTLKIAWQISWCGPHSYLYSLYSGWNLQYNERTNLLNGLSNLGMKSDETMRELLNRITDIMVINKERYAEYQTRSLICRTMWTTFQMWWAFSKGTYFEQHFWLKSETSLPSMTKGTWLPLKLMALQWHSKERAMTQGGSRLCKTKRDLYKRKLRSPTLQRWQNWQGARPMTNQPRNNQSNQGAESRPGNNFNPNRKYCYDCKLQNHRQEECKWRIGENKTCRHRQGRVYWPRV